MSRIVVALIWLVFVISCKSNKIVILPTGPNTLTEAERALGWELLFNGEDLTQWRLFKSSGTKGWTVENDQMIALGLSGLSADIITIDTFSNFELSLEWKISKGGNSGIFFNVRETDQLKSVYASGPEYQLIDDDGYPGELETWQMTGANYAMHPPKIHVHNPQGTFNHSRLIVDNGKVQHWLNDRLIVQYSLWTPEWKQLKNNSKWKDYPEYGVYKSGHIALQDHGNRVSFRNIKIRRI